MVSVIRFWYGIILLWQGLSCSYMGEFWFGNCYQILIWENYLIVRVIRFWYGRTFLFLVTAGSGMGECCDGKSQQDSGMEKFCDGNCYQILVWENFLMVRVIGFWYARIL